MLTIYGYDGCAPCAAIKKYLDNKGIKYDYRQSEGAEYEQLASLYGFIKPLVTKGEDGFSGLNWKKLREFIGE